MSTFAERLKELRGTESQASFAEAIGVNRVQYAKYEAGKNVPSVDILANICRVHACSADWLLGLRELGARAAVVVNGSGNVVANGVKARASAVANGVHAACKDCAFKKAVVKLQKAGLQIPGLP